jgi:2-polyprenyl-3-methyl-5-hydroxy-6-metoxy-1,4-benzoquinol methylase
MDVVERLTLEAAGSHELIACEHRHRYEFAARLCGGLRVLDLCCGSGYGSEILAREAAEVVGVDNDAATVDLAQSTVGRDPKISFEIADAVAYLRADLGDRFEAIVCFEGLEHLAGIDEALALLRGHADAGMRLIASVPNSRLFDEDNPHHVTDFGYEGALEAFAGFPELTMVPQFLAEGSLIVPENATGTEVSVALEDRRDPAYANHFIFCSSIAEDDVAAVHHGRMQLEAAPAYNRHMKALEQANAELRRANARLARQRLGKSDSAAASHLAKQEDLRRRAEQAEAKVAELQDQVNRFGLREARVAATAAPPPSTNGGCTNTWEDRYRRAREYLVPWVSQTIELDGKTVLEYGCGHAPVSCAFAERVARHIGLDIDADAVETGRRLAAERGVENLELHAHPVEEIVGAMAEHQGEVDVVLLYAVLEHLTLEERLEVLRKAREVAQPDGHVVVCETPNRLFPFDHHSSHLPFFTMLPDELALQMYERSSRPDYLNAIGEAMRAGPEAGREALVRWGRGVSYHEFELVFGQLSHYVAASSYDLVLLPERQVNPEELALARYLERMRPDLAPAFSRAWLDLILTAWPLEEQPRFVRPWTMETTESPGVGYTAIDRLALPDAATTVWMSLPAPTNRVVVGAVFDASRASLSARGETMQSDLAATLTGEPGQTHYAAFDLPEPSTRVELGLSRPGELTFLGYEG